MDDLISAALDRWPGGGAIAVGDGAQRPPGRNNVPGLHFRLDGLYPGSDFGALAGACFNYSDRRL